MAGAKSDLPQGTLDLILKIVALAPVHGYAIGQPESGCSQRWSRP
jgi:hypothetical protein